LSGLWSGFIKRKPGSTLLLEQVPNEKVEKGYWVNGCKTATPTSYPGELEPTEGALTQQRNEGWRQQH